MRAKDMQQFARALAGHMRTFDLDSLTPGELESFASGLELNVREQEQRERETLAIEQCSAICNHNKYDGEDETPCYSCRKEYDLE